MESVKRGGGQAIALLIILAIMAVMQRRRG